MTSIEYIYIPNTIFYPRDYDFYLWGILRSLKNYLELPKVYTKIFYLKVPNFTLQNVVPSSIFLRMVKLLSIYTYLLEIVKYISSTNSIIRYCLHYLHPQSAILASCALSKIKLECYFPTLWAHNDVNPKDFSEELQHCKLIHVVVFDLGDIRRSQFIQESLRATSDWTDSVGKLEGFDPNKKFLGEINKYCVIGSN